MDKNMTLEKRIDAELYSYQGRICLLYTSDAADE